MLEFSDNLIDCDVSDSRQSVSEATNDNQSSSNGQSSSTTDNLLGKVNVESKNCVRDIISKLQENAEMDLNRNPMPINSNRSEDWSKIEPVTTTITQIPSANIRLVLQQTPLNNTSQTEHAHTEAVSCNSAKSETVQCEEQLVHIDSNNDFLSNKKISGRTSDLSRQSDHVSCEDLLEFACDRPNTRRTRGPRNGEQSDEVRIMLKVLHEQSTPESCIAALNVTEWDVLAAIKLERLQGLLKKENSFVGLEDCKMMLHQCGGDVVKAAALLRSTEDTAAV